MNKKIILKTIGRIMIVEAILLVLPIIVSVLYHETWAEASSFVYVSLGSLLLGLGLNHIEANTDRLYATEGYIIAALGWIVISFIGALPFVINGSIPNVIDAFFETASGFTTTGASIINDLSLLNRSTLFWRSFTHLIGGMGFLVFVLAIIPNSESNSVHVMKAEMPGPTFGKLVSKLSNTARILYLIYLLMTLVLIVLLMGAGAPGFDAVLLAFGAAGTGGFGVLNGSIAPYNSLAIEMILGIAMIVFGVNFNLYFLIVSRKWRESLKDEELKWYLGTIVLATLCIAFNLYSHQYSSSRVLRDSFFTVSSVITTTGYSTADFGQWPLFSQLILLGIMFVGGMAGSTAGGLKVSRIAVLVKSALAEVKRSNHPHRVMAVMFNKHAVSHPDLRAVLNYLVIYAGIFIISLIFISIEAPDFMTAFSSVAATFNNIGPGLAEVGPTANYSNYGNFNTLILGLTMLIGRLEIIPMIILLSPSTWHSRI